MSQPVSVTEFFQRLGVLLEQLDAEDLDRLPTPVLAEQIIARYRLIDHVQSMAADLDRTARK